MKILSFGASASKQSINKQFAHYVADRLEMDDTEKIDLIDYPLPIYTLDEEKENGFPANVHLFLEKVYSADLIVISMAEHNGTYTTWFKNLFDWASRVNTKFFTDKKIILLSTSPGPRGGIGSLSAAEERFPRHGAKIIATFSLPNFETNYSKSEGIQDNDLKIELEKIISQVKTQ
jgi:NAD(P)H-dependent FMN reductase